MSTRTSGVGAAFASTFKGAGWHPKLVVSLISLVFLFEAVNLQYVAASTALPLIAARFHTTQSAWVLTIYALTGAVTAPLVGKLADRFGKRRLLFTVMVISVFGSIVGATAQSFEVLLLGRTLEGCLIASSFLNYSLVRDVYPPKVIPFAATVTLTGTGVLSTFAPALVGVCIDHYGFRSVFVVNAALVAVLILIIGLTTRESDVRAESRIDLPGAFLVAAAVGAVLCGISMGNTWGWTNSSTMGLIIGGIAAGVCYAFYSTHRTEPLLDIRMFTRRGILIATAVAIAAYASQTVGLVLVPIIGMTPRMMGGGYGLGLTATELAKITTPVYLIGMVGGLLAGVIIRAIGPWNTARTGLVLFALGLAFLGLWHDSIAEMAAGTCLVLVGSGWCLASIPNIVIAAAPSHDQGSYAAGLQLISSAVGATAPVLLFTVLGRSAFTGPGGAVVYKDSAISTSYFASLVLVLVILVTLSTVLRPRPDRLEVSGDSTLAATDPKIVSDIAEGGLLGAPPEGLVDPLD